MLDADAVINNSSQKVGGSNAYPDPAPKKGVGPDPEKTHRINAPGHCSELGRLVLNACVLMRLYVRNGVGGSRTVVQFSSVRTLARCNITLPAGRSGPADTGWNTLPSDLHDITDTGTLRKRLKSVLYDRAYH